MRTLDDTDREIIRLLLSDGRRPYSDIAERVDLSAPAVADRVERLEEVGVIRSFTVDVDRTKLGGGTPLLVELTAPATDAAAVGSALTELDRVEQVLRAAGGDVLAVVAVPEREVASLLAPVLDRPGVEIESVRLVAERAWMPDVEEADLALACDECGNTVTAEGVAAEIDGDRYHFCCDSCRSNFRERYERFRADA